MEPVIGNCGKHPGQSMVNCPLCEIERSNKKTTKHTPGPWHPVEYAGYIMLQKEGGYSMDDDLLNREKCDQAEANSKLAAASPEMYDILYEIFKEEGMMPNTLGKINQLLNKINS